MKNLNALIIVLFLINFTYGQINLNTTLVGRLADGPCLAVDLQNNIVCYHNGGYLELADVSDPDNPIKLGKIILPTMIEDIVVQGNFAYVANGESGIVIIDITDPNNPTESGKCDLRKNALGIAINGSYAYVAYGSEAWLGLPWGLQIVDVSDPFNPTEVNFFETTDHPVNLDVKGDYVYLAAGGMRIIDVSDVTNPNEVGCYYTANWVQDVEVRNGIAYILDMLFGVYIVNVSNPALPVLLSHTSLDHFGLGITIGNSIAYISEWISFRAIDISDPTNPSTLDTIGLSGLSQVAVVDSSSAYVASSSGGLRIVDIREPTNLREKGFICAGGGAGAVAINEETICVGRGDRLDLINISDTTNPVIQSHLEIGGRIEVRDSLAYIAGNDFYIVNIDDVSNPEIIGTCETRSRVSGFDVQKDYAYVLNSSLQLSGLQIIDISDPTNPLEIGFFEYIGGGIVVNENYAYIGLGGFLIIDISNPSNPTQVGQWQGDCNGIDVKNNYAYITCENGMKIIDVSNPQAPFEVGHWQGGIGAGVIRVSNQYAYLGAEENQLHIIDISDPVNPTEIGYYFTNGSIADIAIKNSYVFVADGFDGLYILRTDIISGVEKIIFGKPEHFELGQNYPNPFNPTTTINFQITGFSFVTLKVYDVLGNEIETLINEEKPSGTYEIIWYAGRLPSGVYFYQLKTGDFIETKKMVLMK